LHYPACPNERLIALAAPKYREAEDKPPDILHNWRNDAQPPGVADFQINPK
jgi:hypothetical protein